MEYNDFEVQDHENDVNETMLKVYEYLPEEEQDILVAQLVGYNQQGFLTSESNLFLGNLLFRIAQVE